MDIRIESPIMLCKPPENAAKVSIRFEYYRPRQYHCFVLRWYDENGKKLYTEALWPETSPELTNEIVGKTNTQARSKDALKI